jgi:hypothetical protein
MSQIEDDEREVIALVNAIEADLLRVLEHHTRMQDDAGTPRYSRAVALHATCDLLGRLMLSAIQIEGERGRESSRRLVQHLQMLLTPTPTARAH